MTKRKTRAELETELAEAHEKIAVLEKIEAARLRDADARYNARTAQAKADADAAEARYADAEAARALLVEAYQATVAMDAAMLDGGLTADLAAKAAASRRVVEQARVIRSVVERLAALSVVRVQRPSLTTYALTAGWLAIGAIAPLAFALLGIGKAGAGPAAPT